jgi:hypothetical protein
MLKVGLPKPAVMAKMEQEGVDPSYLNRDPNEMVGQIVEELPPFHLKICFFYEGSS